MQLLWLNKPFHFHTSVICSRLTCCVWACWSVDRSHTKSWVKIFCFGFVLKSESKLTASASWTKTQSGTAVPASVVDWKEFNTWNSRNIFCKVLFINLLMALLTYSSDIFGPGCHINYPSLHSLPPSLRPSPTAPSSPQKCFWKLQFFILMASVTAWYCTIRDARHSHRLEKYSFCAVHVLGWRGGPEKAEKQERADRSG